MSLLFSDFDLFYTRISKGSLLRNILWSQQWSLTYYSRETPNVVIGKQCRPRSDLGLYCLKIVKLLSLYPWGIYRRHKSRSTCLQVYPHGLCILIRNIRLQNLFGQKYWKKGSTEWGQRNNRNCDQNMGRAMRKRVSGYMRTRAQISLRIRLHCPLRELLDTTKCIKGEQMPGTYFAHVQNDLKSRGILRMFECTLSLGMAHMCILHYAQSCLFIWTVHA